MPFALAQRRVRGDGLQLPFRSREAPIVAGEHHHGPVRDLFRFERAEQAAHVIVQAGDHGRVDRVILRRPGRPRFATETPRRFLFRLNRDMHCVMRQVEEERLAAMGADEFDTLVSQAVCQILPVPLARNGWIVAPSWPEKALRHATVGPAYVDGEALRLGPVFLGSSQVPFPDMTAHVSGGLERLGDRNFAGIEILLANRADHLRMRQRMVARQIVGDAGARRKAPGHEGCPRG